MNLDDLTKRQGAWLHGDGPESDVVISSRIRLARNIKGFPFVSHANSTDLKVIEQTAVDAVTGVLPENTFTCLDFHAISRDDAMFLQERQMVSADFAENVIPRSLVMAQDESYSIMINEEDHLRIQTVASGLVLKELWEKTNNLDDLIESKLDYAFDEGYGYLTACPSNVGTGLRASVMMHLPALIETDEMAKVMRSLEKMNFEVRGMYGEGSRALGELFQVSNQKTLGVTEEQIVEQLSDVIPCILKYERMAREELLEKNRDGLLDRCHRALGTLQSARLTSMEEAMKFLSSIRLGVRMGLFKDVSVELVNELLMNIQPVHLRKLAQMRGDGSNDDASLRARYIRERLAGLGIKDEL